MKSAPTGQLLVERGACSAEAVARAQKVAKSSGTRLCSELLTMGVCEEVILASILAEQQGVPGVDISRTVIPLDVLSRVPRQVAEADLILPLSQEGGRIHLAVATIDPRVIDEVRFISNMEVSTYVAVHAALQKAIHQAYDAHAEGEAIWRGASASSTTPFLALVLPVSVAAEGPEANAETPMLLDDDVEIVVGGNEGEVVAEVQVQGGAKRVLVVDDEPEIRKLVAHALGAKGFSVEIAADGEEALNKVSSMIPDLVMLDAMLPRVHGFEVCLKIKSDPRTRHVPVIIMTALYRGWRFAQDARENYGAEDYIEKPFRLDDLLRRVTAVLEATAGRSSSEGASVEQPLRRGKELLSAGKLVEAVTVFEEVIQRDRFSAEAHYHLARALRSRGEHFRAMTEFEQAVELRSGFFVALRSLAALYIDKGFRRKAAETLERALAAAPDESTRQLIKDDLLRIL